MNHEEIKNLLAVYPEGELSDEEKHRVEKHLAECPECQKEFDEFHHLEEVLSEMKLREPSTELWEAYWSSVYNRMERRAGWIVFSVGLIILLCFGTYQALKDMLGNTNIPTILVVGLLTFVCGGIILFVSILKEQLFCRKRERYKEISK